MVCYSEDEVDEYSKDGKVIIIRNHRVYDISRFAKSHPGKAVHIFELGYFVWIDCGSAEYVNYSIYMI